MDKREVVPTMKGKRPGFDLVGKGQGIVAGARHLGGRFTWMGNNREELLCRKRAVRTAWLSFGQILDGDGTFGKETHHFLAARSSELRLRRRRPTRGTTQKCRRSTQCCAST